MAKIAADHPWFAGLDAEHRSWISLVAHAGIEGFIEWFAAAGDSPAAANVFTAAPPVLARQVSLQQTVDLVRSTIDTMESEIDRLPPEGQPALQLAVVHYSREIAFAAAQTYARAAEQRGAWDARLEALVVDAVVRGDADHSLVSRAATLGWSNPDAVCAIVGAAPEHRVKAVERLRRLASRVKPQPIELLAAAQGDRLVLVAGGAAEQFADAESVAGEFEAEFGPGCVVVSPVVRGLSELPRAARSALSGLRCAHAWPAAPRVVAAADLLPERALAGDGHARRILADEIYRPLSQAGADLVATLSEYLDQGSSIEATARALYIHPNTVRYRLRRIQEVTGRSPADPRDRYSLRLALTLGRLLA
jgi:DNA-binding PucR family transcriptional regulator